MPGMNECVRGRVGRTMNERTRTKEHLWMIFLTDSTPNTTPTSLFHGVQGILLHYQLVLMIHAPVLHVFFSLSHTLPTYDSRFLS